MSFFLSYKSAIWIKVKCLVPNGVLSFCCCCSGPGSISLLWTGQANFYKAWPPEMLRGLAILLLFSFSSSTLASMYLFAVVVINCCFPPVLHEILTGLKFCLVSCFALSCLQHTELLPFVRAFSLLQNAFTSIISCGTIDKSVSMVRQGPVPSGAFYKWGNRTSEFKGSAYSSKVAMEV